MAVSFRYRLLDEFLKEWQLRKKQLREGEITKEEYLEWKLNWPQTADGWYIGRPFCKVDRGILWSDYYKSRNKSIFCGKNASFRRDKVVICKN